MNTILILSIVLLAVISSIVALLLLAQQARPCPRRPEGTTTTDFKEQG